MNLRSILTGKELNHDQPSCWQCTTTPREARGFLNLLTRKIVCDCASVRLKSIFLLRFYNFLSETWFLDENTRFWTKIRDFAANFFLENRRLLTERREFAAHIPLKIDDFGRKYAVLRLISNLIINVFG